jgi:hypothetical protein
MAAQKTLLKCVQDILTSMKSDEVSSIDETAESTAVTSILEGAYYDLVSTIDFPENWDFFTLELVDGTDYPTVLKLPANVGKLEYIQYDISDVGDTVKKWQTIRPRARSEFLGEGTSLDSDDPDVFQFEWDNLDLRGKKDADPQYYTTLDDEHLLFDSYNSAYSISLIASKTRCYGMIYPEFERDNDFVPPFEPRQFTLFFNEAKARAFVDLKEVQNPKAEQWARRGLVQSQRKQPRVAGGEIQETWMPNYGRRR